MDGVGLADGRQRQRQRQVEEKDDELDNEEVKVSVEVRAGLGAKQVGRTLLSPLACRVSPIFYFSLKPPFRATKSVSDVRMKLKCFMQRKKMETFLVPHIQLLHPGCLTHLYKVCFVIY